MLVHSAKFVESRSEANELYPACSVEYNVSGSGNGSRTSCQWRIRRL